MFTVFFPSSPPFFFLLLADSNSELCFTLFRIFRADGCHGWSPRELAKETIYLLKNFNSPNLEPGKNRNV